MPRRRREGAILVVVALAMVGMLGLASMAVDVGHVYKVRTELQGTADAAAHAAATQLDATSTGINNAEQKAKDVALENRAYASGVSLRDEDIIFGFWDNAQGTFTPNEEPTSNPASVNAVRVVARMDEQAGTPVSAVFGGFVGHAQTEVSGMATAAAGGPVRECAFPMVVPQCVLDTGTGEDCGVCFQFSSDTVDTAGWSTLGLTNGSGKPQIASLIQAGCFDENGNPSVDPDTGQCTGGCAQANIDETVPLNNGEGILQGGSGPCELIEQILGRNGGTPESFVVKVPSIVNDSDCANVKFASHADVVGFAEVEIFGVKCGKNQTAVLDPNFDVSASSPCGSPAEAYIRGVLHCDSSSTEPGGGGYLSNNTTTVRPRLVQ
ncbi:MAG: pilus assembly protein TadG-related protein [Myxococcales bacterium]|jgi:Flp pilus assembly protein TadG